MVQETSNITDKSLLPLLICRLDVALRWVTCELNMKSRLSESTLCIEVMIADNCWMPTCYIFSDDCLYKEIK